MQVSRRRLLAAAAVVPLVVFIERGARVAVEGAWRAVAALRPPSTGTSATRCALCGSGDHTMLDPRCPTAKRVI